jgi:purine-binding chemotaxis protein CheW
MAKTADTRGAGRTVELATFHVGEALCGMDILKIQEINKHIQITTVPQGPDYVLGVLNLRGRIVTIIDLSRKIGLPPANLTENSRNIIVNSKDEYIGLIVDQIGDVVATSTEKVEPPPANIGGLQGRYFEGVVEGRDSLIGILNIEEVLKEDDL